MNIGIAVDGKSLSIVIPWSRAPGIYRVGKDGET